MSNRAGYSDDFESNIWLINWRGAVASAIRGKTGRAFLRELREALLALPERRLIAEDLVKEGEVCALGAVGKARGLDMTKVDPEDHESVSALFGIPNALAREIEYTNDEWYAKTPEERFDNVLKWVDAAIAQGDAAEAKRAELRAKKEQAK